MRCCSFYSGLVAVVLLSGCAAEKEGASAAEKGRLDGQTAASTRDTGAKLPHTEKLAADWASQRTLPARRPGAFDARDLSPPAAAPRRAAEPVPEPPAAAPPLPPPFRYVGKVVRGQEAFAVLLRDERVFVVSPGEKLAERYRVHAVMDRQVVLADLDANTLHSLPYSAGAVASGLLPGGAPGTAALDAASLALSGPSQVAMGEQFTLTVSLDSGANSMLETGRVEVRFDPNALAIPGQAQASGSARIDISGAYVGHPAPATLQFRVIAKSPTATEIRVVPTNVADSDGRTVGVNPPQAHRLKIVQPPPVRQAPVREAAEPEGESEGDPN